MFERIKQMDRQTVITLVLAGVLGIFLFSTITGGIRQAGWNEGYTAGLLTNRGESATVVEPAVSQRNGEPASNPVSNPGVYTRSYEARGWGGHPFGFVGGFFRFIFIAFLLMMVFKLIAFRRWHMHGGPRWPHRHHGPWGRHYENRYGGQPQEQPQNPAQGEPQSAQSSQPVSHVTQPNVKPDRPNDWIHV